MLLGVILVAGIGFVICLYGLYIERQVLVDHAYKAVCDISDRASCTKTFLSPWGKLLGFSNIYVGIVFYLAMIALGFFGQAQLIFLGAVGACLASVFLAYILATKVKTFCLLCSSIYLINIILLIVAYKNL